MSELEHSKKILEKANLTIMEHLLEYNKLILQCNSEDELGKLADMFDIDITILFEEIDKEIDKL